MKPYGLWISPKGDFWEVPNKMGHENVAPQITGEIFNCSDDLMPYSRYLLSSGFARVIYEQNYISVETYGKMTKHQREIIKIESEDFPEDFKHEIQEYSFLDFICHAHFNYNFVPLVEFVYKSPQGENAK